MKMRRRKVLLSCLLFSAALGGLLYFLSPGKSAVRQVPVTGHRALTITRAFQCNHAVNEIAWHPSGDYLVVLERDDQRRSYLTKVPLSGNAGKTFESEYSTAQPFLNVDISPDGKLIAGCFWDIDGDHTSIVRVWNWEDMDELKTLKVPPLEGLGVGFSSDLLVTDFSADASRISAGTKLVDQAVIAGGHIGGEVCTWDLSSGSVLWTDRHSHTDIVYAVKYSDDGSVLATGGYDKHIKLWDQHRGVVKRTLVGLGWHGLSCLDISPDNRWLATAGNGVEEGGRVRVWNLETGTIVHTFSPSTLGLRNITNFVAFHSSGSKLCVVGVVDLDDPAWKIVGIDVQSGVVTDLLPAQKGVLAEASFSSDRDEVAVGTTAGELLVVSLDGP